MFVISFRVNMVREHGVKR